MHDVWKLLHVLSGFKKTFEEAKATGEVTPALARDVRRPRGRPGSPG